MATKTLTITEDAYNLLVQNKLDDESFSMEIKRLLSFKPRRPLTDFLGVLSDETGKKALEFLDKKRSTPKTRPKETKEMFS